MRLIILRLIFICYDINPTLHQTCAVLLEMDYSIPDNHLFHYSHPNALGNHALERPIRPSYIYHRELSSRGKSSNADKMSSRKTPQSIFLYSSHQVDGLSCSINSLCFFNFLLYTILDNCTPIS